MTEERPAAGDPSAGARHAVLDQLPDGVLIADGQGVVRAANAEAAELLELTCEQLVGRGLDDLPLAGTDGRGWCDWNRPLEGLRTRTGVPEQAWMTAGGREVLVTASIHRDRPRGTVTGMTLALRSGRGRQRLDRARSDLLATAAHELRSPLTGVKGFVQVMLNRWEKLSDEQKRLMLTTVLADADRLSRLITELLDVARIDTGRLRIAPRPSDLGVLVDRVVALVRAGTSRTIEYAAPDGDPVWGRVDPDKFSQVVNNLVENALRHGDGVVSVRLVPGDPGTDGTGTNTATGPRLVVEDEGTGIPVEMRQRALTKFWSGGGGSGLGLYLVHGLVHAHGGRLEIGATERGGARVWVAWPG